MAMIFGMLGKAFGRLGAARVADTASEGEEGEAGDSLLLFNSEGITLLHLGLI